MGRCLGGEAVSLAEEGQRVQGRGELGLHPADGMGTPLPVTILSP